MTKEDKNTLLLLGGGAAIYFAVLRPILIKLGLQADPKVKATDTRKENQLNDAIKQAENTQKSTKTLQEWQIIADAIYNDLRYSAISDNKANAVYQVCRVQNMTDFLLLYKLFGKRREYLFGVPSGGLMDLQQFITSNLSNSQLATINWNYKNKGINYKF